MKIIINEIKKIFNLKMLSLLWVSKIVLIETQEQIVCGNIGFKSIGFTRDVNTCMSTMPGNTLFACMWTKTHQLWQARLQLNVNLTEETLSTTF